ncbi:50S ribosomal protein L11 methyltransferase [Rubellicoccus peritrichatus]|uniref:50S ribosomal protein L11 methyltransferase n=1 Tax=Rubellicoccus peritrichatus TaxID=3080537 RepID=A0AAQ3LCL7_9BACT|nr:50S ribosomal protein L11 methyltransferase [Puniceicoccus sp. CR14]WOO43235.1 50S ribosomal protein L11 methyltransferase [Puniceicoccus sp. CR14]
MYTVQCEIPESLADELEALLCENVRSSWSLHQDKVGQPFKLKGFFEEDGEAETAYAELRADCKTLPENPEFGSIEDREWKEAYKAFIKPWDHKGLHWVPAWQRETYVVPADEVAVYLDAGLAFGTGSHETTRLMARRLIDFRAEKGNAFSSQNIIDAGCGSGILAISAQKLGAHHLYGFDRDPEAIRVSNENIVFNDLPANSIPFEEGGIEQCLGNRTADLILANIQADVLKIHAESFIESTNKDGTLALSGILARELDEVRECFDAIAKAQWDAFKIDTRTDGEWSDLVLFRK